MRPIEKHSIIEINNVTKDFGSVRALNGVSMQIKQGEFFHSLDHPVAVKQRYLE